MKLNRLYTERANLVEDDEKGGSSIKELCFLNSQRSAFNAVAKLRLTLVWGPPGTGKTHFLGLCAMRMMEIAAACQRPMKVLVTAYTNTAIDALLNKLTQFASLEKEIYRDIPGKLAFWTDKARISRTRADSPKKTDFQRDLYEVIGSTSWQLHKISSQITFDLIIVDEGSQLPVGAAMLFMERLSPGGRLVVAGDPLQLAPISTYLH